MKKGLLIHSYNCNEPNWLETVWGFPPDRPGRAVTALKIILEEEIDIALICGTAGEKDGKKESWWFKDLIYRRLEEFKSFTVFPVFQEYTADELRKILDRVLVIREKDTGANTAGELEYAGRFFTEAGVTKVFNISSGDHGSRCLRDLQIAWREKHPSLALNAFTSTSWTLYSERAPEDKEIAKMSNVVIAEPPVMKTFNLARIFKVLKNPEALAEIDAALKKAGA